MKKIKLFCMQKNEADILEDWILYHSYLFGINNIMIIDNNSTDDSIKILNEYKKYGLVWLTKDDYTKKGDYMYELIKQSDCDIAIPIDIDEFIACFDISNISHEYGKKLAQNLLSFDKNYYAKKINKKMSDIELIKHYIREGFINNIQVAENISENITFLEISDILKKYEKYICMYHPEQSVSCDKDEILNKINELGDCGRYSFNNYLTTRNDKPLYKDPMVDINTYDIIDIGDRNKKFFLKKKLKGVDHGNHHGNVCDLTENMYEESKLILFHYHNRGTLRLIEKCRNDIIGLKCINKINNVEDISELNAKLKGNFIGKHNIETYLKYLTHGPESLITEDKIGRIINVLPQKIQYVRKFDKNIK